MLLGQGDRVDAGCLPRPRPRTGRTAAGACAPARGPRGRRRPGRRWWVPRSCHDRSHRGRHRDAGSTTAPTSRRPAALPRPCPSVCPCRAPRTCPDRLPSRPPGPATPTPSVRRGSRGAPGRRRVPGPLGSPPPACCSRATCRPGSWCRTRAARRSWASTSCGSSRTSGSGAGSRRRRPCWRRPRPCASASACCRPAPGRWCSRRWSSAASPSCSPDGWTRGSVTAWPAGCAASAPGRRAR